MKIGIIAVDSKYPNLALMKISAHHKIAGDIVEWYTPYEHYDCVTVRKGRRGIKYITICCDAKDVVYFNTIVTDEIKAKI